jgi:Tol biopolymer transport system component
MKVKVNMVSTNRIFIRAVISALLLGGVFVLQAIGSAVAADTPDAKSTYGVFTNPQPVTIVGYSQDAMEPFISPDGNYLFFNSSNNPPAGTYTNLYYATHINDVTFQFQGEIGGVNTTALDAVASMDVNNTFFFVSTRSYPQTLSTIYSGNFSNGNVSNIAIVPGISKLTPGDVNFDQCISPDGSTLYFVDGVFNGGSVPQSASIEIATRNGDHFVRLKNSAKIMRQINKHGLNYAPDISKSGLEFFFTRFDGTLPAIYTASRAKTSKPFGKPRKIDAITGFAEAPALSPDEKSLYYHFQNASGVYVIYRVTRP